MPVARIIKPDSAQVNRVAVRQRIFCALLLPLLSVIAVFGIACSEEDRARGRYEKAQELVEQGDFEEAAQLLQEIADRFPATETARRAREEATLYRGLASAIESYPLRRVRDEMVRTARAIYDHRNRRRAWPRSLGQLVPQFLDTSPRDPWGRPLVYVPKQRGYLLACLGADGRRGGNGEARDWFIEDGRFVAKPSVSLP